MAESKSPDQTIGPPVLGVHKDSDFKTPSAAEMDRIARNATHPGVDTSRPVHRTRDRQRHPDIHPEKYEGVTTMTEDTIVQYRLPAHTIIFDEEGNEIGRFGRPTDVNVTEIKRPAEDSGPAPTFTFETVNPVGKGKQKLTGIVQKRGKVWVGANPEKTQNGQ